MSFIIKTFSIHNADPAEYSSGESDESIEDILIKKQSENLMVSISLAKSNALNFFFFHQKMIKNTNRPRNMFMDQNFSFPKMRKSIIGRAIQNIESKMVSSTPCLKTPTCFSDESLLNISPINAFREDIEGGTTNTAAVIIISSEGENSEQNKNKWPVGFLPIQECKEEINKNCIEKPVIQDSSFDKKQIGLSLQHASDRSVLKGTVY